jgi:hypothetical protein
MKKRMARLAWLRQGKGREEGVKGKPTTEREKAVSDLIHPNSLY